MKYKAEKYINQRLLKNGWSFQVIIRKDNKTITKTFNENEYGSARVAFDYAVNYRNRILNEIAENRYLSPVSLPLRAVFDESEQLGNYNKKTQRNHQTMFDRFIGDVPLDSFTPDFMIMQMNKMSLDYSDDQISRVFSLMKQIDYTAVLKQYYPSPRTIGVKPPKSKKIMKVKNDRITDKDTIEAVLKKCQDETIRGVILTAYYTGMRPGEIFALGEDDIKDGWIHVYKQIGSDLEEEGVVRNTKNQSSTRMIPISPFLQPVLERFSGPVLFLTASGENYTSNRFNAVTAGLFRPYKLNLYKLRHLFATTLEYSGVDRRTIDALMGHVPKDSTDIYVHTNNERLVKAIGKISEISGTSSGTSEGTGSKSVATALKPLF